MKVEIEIRGPEIRRLEQEVARYLENLEAEKKEEAAEIEEFCWYHCEGSTVISDIRWYLDNAEAAGKKTVGVLEIEFRHGARYKYERVHPDLVKAFRAAESAGQFYNDWIKGNFLSFKLEKKGWTWKRVGGDG
jgi:hypothetical protein